MAANSLFTLSEIANEVSQIYGSTDDITQAKAKKWINRALMRINEMGDWSWLMVFDGTFTASSGTETYALATNVKKVYSIFYSSGVRRKLRLMDDRIFRSIATQVTTPQGTPLWYRLYGRDASGNRKVALWPIPNATLTMYYDYRKEIDLLVNDSDDVRTVTGMPDHMVDALIELAAAIGMRELDDSDYESAMSEAVARWKNLLAEDLSEIDDGIRMRAYEADATNYQDPVLPAQYTDSLW